MSCGWICAFRTVLTVVCSVWSSWIYILDRACWWGPIKAKTCPCLFCFSKLNHFFVNWLHIAREYERRLFLLVGSLWKKGFSQHAVRVSSERHKRRRWLAKWLLPHCCSVRILHQIFQHTKFWLIGENSPAYSQLWSVYMVTRFAHMGFYEYA